MTEYEPAENVVASVMRDAVEYGNTEERMKSVLRTWLRAEVRRILKCSREEAEKACQL